MNKVLVGFIALLVIGSGVFVLLGGSDEDSTTAQNTDTASQAELVAQQPDSATNQQEPAQEQAESDVAEEPVAQAGAYVDYSDTVLAETADTKRVLFFHAEWCSVCKNFENQINTTGVPAGVTIIETDYDKETDLKEQYGVRTQSTFVLLDETGEVVQTWPFGQGLSGNIQNLFDQVLAA